jgi:hypothetical protein
MGRAAGLVPRPQARLGQARRAEMAVVIDRAVEFHLNPAPRLL